VGVLVGVVIAITSVFVLSMPIDGSPIDGAMLARAAHGHTVAQIRRTFRDSAYTLAKRATRPG
jgi:hypothetical protein